jgi:hypothetical protein
MNKSQSAYYLKLSADQGDADAQFNYGLQLYETDGISMNHSHAAYYVRLAADQGHMNAQIVIARMLQKGCEIKMNRSKAVHYLKQAADQGSVEAQLNYANCLIGGDGIETDKGEAERYLQLAASQGYVKAHMRYGIVLLSGQLGRFDISRARIEFKQVGSQNRFGSQLLSALSGPLDRAEVIENHQNLSTIFTFLRTGESHDTLIIRVLNKHFNANAVAEPASVAAWRDLASETLRYLGDFKELWELLGSLPRAFCESVSIPEMATVVLCMYSKESSLYENVNFFLRNFPVEVASKFINELRGLLSYIYLLQSSINHLVIQKSLEEEVVVYRGLHDIDPGLVNCYISAIGYIILWRSFTSTSRSLELTVDRFVRSETGILFEIHLYPGNIAVDISRDSAFREFEILIPAYTTFHVEGVVDLRVQEVFPAFQQDIIVPLVKLSYASSWFDFALD